MIKTQSRILSGAVLSLTAAIGLNAGISLAADASLAGAIDGEPKEWVVVERETTSTASFSELSPGLIRVTIEGHQDDLVTTEGSLVITFMVMQGSPRETEVNYFPEASRVPVYTLSESDGLSLDTLDIDGDRARIVGSVEDELPRQESFTDEPDPDDSIQLEVRFDVTARRQ